MVRPELLGGRAVDVPDRVRPAVVAPTYNNAGTLLHVLDRLETLGLPLVVVDDGSTDATRSRLAAWVRRDRDRAETVRHARNLGKAAALRTGFYRARLAGCTHAVTIDTDGQHDPEEIPDLLAAARRTPEALVLGARRYGATPPWASRVGCRLSNLAIRLACGSRLTDSQSGFRVYPLSLVEALRCDADRYAYETEILPRAKWAGHPLVEVPIRSRYPPASRRVSHYRVGRDTLLCAAAHLRLCRHRWRPRSAVALTAFPRSLASLGRADPREFSQPVTSVCRESASSATGSPAASGTHRGHPCGRRDDRPQRNRRRPEGEAEHGRANP